MDGGLSIESWTRLRSAIAALRAGDWQGTRRELGGLASIDAQENLKLNYAVQYITYTVLSVRLPVGPFSVEATDRLVETTVPTVRNLRAMITEPELRDAGRLALGLPPESPFDGTADGATTRLMGTWLMIASVLVENMVEIDGLRSGVDQFILESDDWSRPES